MFLNHQGTKCTKMHEEKLAYLKATEQTNTRHPFSFFIFHFSFSFVLLCALCVFVVQTKAQDFHFSQFYEMPMLRNPALAGVFKGDLRIAVAHRSQWQSVTVPFQTSAANIEYKLPVFNFNDYITIGAQVVHDIAGDVKLKRTQVFPVVNYHKSLSDDEDNYLSLAFMGGPVTSQFDPSQAKMDDQFVSGTFSPGNASAQTFSNTGFTYWDASTGLTYSSGFGEASRFYLGLAYFHFMKPKINFFSSNSETHLNQKWVLNAGLNTPTGDNSRLLFLADYFAQGGHRQVLGGFLYEYDVTQYYEDENVSLGFGSFYRWNDAVIPVVRLRYFKWNLGLSYDVNVSKLKTASQMRGGFELTGSYRGFLNIRSTSRDKMRCVSF
jgi:type IX secretion system PorP/SprF family membrane protein